MDGIRGIQTADERSGRRFEYLSLIGSDKYILMYDVYMKGKYQFTESTDLENFKVIDHAVSMDFHPRHGTVIPITEKELKRLYKVYGKPTGL